MSGDVPRTAEAIVVGGGVIGCAIAYELARAGSSVLLLEAGTLARGASGASAGGVRQQGRDLRELPLAQRAVRRWPRLAEELGAPTGYVQCGHLTLAESPQALAALEARCARERAHGLDVRVVDASALQCLAPGVAPQILGGSWTPEDGQADPALTTLAFAKAAVRAGARIVTGLPVSSVHQHRGRVLGVKTPAGVLSSRWVILAAGAWSGRLASLAGRPLPVVPQALQMLVTRPVPRRPLPVLGAWGRRLSFKQREDGAYLIGGGWLGTVAGHRSVLHPESLRGSARDACAIYPPVAHVPLRRAWAGIEGYTPDGLPMLGCDPILDGLIYACGFCGHGFALAPTVGELIAKLMLEGQSDPILAPCNPARFASADSRMSQLDGSC